MLGMAQTMVTPPAKAAAVPEAKSSLCVPPGSRRCTWTSINPRRTSWGVRGRQDQSQSRAPCNNRDSWAFMSVQSRASQSCSRI